MHAWTRSVAERSRLFVEFKHLYWHFACPCYKFAINKGVLIVLCTNVTWVIVLHVWTRSLSQRSRSHVISSKVKIHRWVIFSSTRLSLFHRWGHKFRTWTMFVAQRSRSHRVFRWIKTYLSLNYYYFAQMFYLKKIT